MSDRIRSVLAEHARLPIDPHTLADGDDLFRAGMTSHASVSVMLGLEEEFDVEFPDRLLHRGSFASIAAIRAALAELLDAAP